MKKKLQFVTMILACILFGGCSFPMSSDGSLGGSQSGVGDTIPDDSCQHVDNDSNELCDLCDNSVVVSVDFYAVNDLHGKFLKTDTQSGIGGMTTYLNEAKTRNPNTVLLSSGDMWQGAWESNLTRGMILNDWMSEMGFVSMTLGNHEFDWGTEYIESNAAQSDFAYLAINVYEHATGERAPYCQPSVMVERGGAKIGIIGAIGDCYSSISADKVTDVYFKVGNELTDLVRAEANRLRAAGADCIVYSLHDGYSGYNEILSNGCVDLVFEGHTHQAYVMQDNGDVYHIQGGGDNDGISYASGRINLVENTLSVDEARVVYHSQYANKQAAPIAGMLQTKYADDLAVGLRVLGKNDRLRNSYELRELAARLYFEAGFKRWGAQYDIVLGGGYLSARSPYDLHSGQIIYGDLLNILPFDNPLVLCSISGAKLKSQFLETNNNNYFIYCGTYGESIRNNVDVNGTYYIVIDTYSSTYKPNGATEIARYDQTTFARDLIADYIEDGNMTSDPTPTPDPDPTPTSDPDPTPTPDPDPTPTPDPDPTPTPDPDPTPTPDPDPTPTPTPDGYVLSTIPEIYAIGNTLADDAETEEAYYVKGKIRAFHNENYGNFTIEDQDGNTLYVYGLYDKLGNKYGEFAEVKPVVGDTIIIQGKVKRFIQNSGNVLIEITNANFIEKTCSAKTYTLTIIPDIYHIGAELGENAESTEEYYVKGKIISIANDTFGNVTIEDENGYKLYIYGINDENGVRYDGMAKKPQVGDTVVLRGKIKRYVTASGETIEIFHSTYIPYET